MPTHRLVRYSAILGLALLLPGCAFFAGKPPLPKQTSIERLPKPATETDYVGIVENADIIYFPTERAASGGRSEPAALVLEALEKTGKPFAIGWEIIYASDQPLLDEIQNASGDAREQLIGRLQLIATGRAREHCRAVLRDARPTSVRHLALRSSPEGEGLIRLAYATQGIVSYFRHNNDRKLLVFASASDLEGERGLPYFVAQKLNVRQLVLGSGNERPKLLTRSRQTYGGKVASRS